MRQGNNPVVKRPVLLERNAGTSARLWIGFPVVRVCEQHRPAIVAAAQGRESWCHQKLMARAAGHDVDVAAGISTGQVPFPWKRSVVYLALER
jgi:hypothetical protein